MKACEKATKKALGAAEQVLLQSSQTFIGGSLRRLQPIGSWPGVTMTFTARYRTADDFNAVQKEDLGAAVRTEMGSNEQLVGKKLTV